MLVNFGRKKCPMCGRIGKRIVNTYTFLCEYCEVVFDDFVCLPLTYAEQSVEECLELT